MQPRNHGTTRKSRQGLIKSPAAAAPAEAPNGPEALQPNRAEIERRFRLFHTVVPADSGEAGRGRTRYFYRSQAIAFRRDARLHWRAETCAACLRLAKHYLAEYRRRCLPA